MKPEYRLDHVRERPVTDIVDQGRDPHGRLVPVVDLIAKAQLCDHPRRQVKCAEAVRKSRVLCRLICEIRKPQLPDPPQPLKLRRIDESDDQPALGSVGIYPDNVVYRIAVNAFHFWSATA